MYTLLCFSISLLKRIRGSGSKRRVCPRRGGGDAGTPAPTVGFMSVANPKGFGRQGWGCGPDSPQGCPAIRPLRKGGVCGHRGMGAAGEGWRGRRGRRPLRWGLCSAQNRYGSGGKDGDAGGACPAPTKGLRSSQIRNLPAVLSPLSTLHSPLSAPPCSGR